MNKIFNTILVGLFVATVATVSAGVLMLLYKLASHFRTIAPDTGAIEILTVSAVLGFLIGCIAVTVYDDTRS